MANARLAQKLNNSSAARVGVVDFEVAPFVVTNLDKNDADLKTFVTTQTNWERAGTIAPGSLKLEVNREEYDLVRGLPRTMHQSFVIGQDGSLEMELDEYTGRGIELAVGGKSLIRTTTGATTVEASPAPTASVFTVASIGSIAPGKWIAITVGGVTYDRKVLSVATAAITLADPLPAAPTSGDAVALITDWRNPIGGTDKQYYHGRILFTDTVGDQAIIFVPKFSPNGRFAPEFRDGEHAMIPIQNKLYGAQMTINSSLDFYLAMHYLIPA